MHIVGRPKSSIIGRPKGAISQGSAGASIPAGYPNASTAGVQDGIVLAAPRGDWDINASGTYENQDVIGYVVINANNVTLRNCRIRPLPGQFGGVVYVSTGKTGVIIEYCDIDGLRTQGLKGVWLDASQGSIVRFCDIRASSDGIFMYGNNHQIRDNYIHDLGDNGPDPHMDCVQTGNTTGHIVDHNTFIGAGDANSCFALASSAEAAAFSMTISNNVLRPGPVMLYLFNVGDGPVNPTSFTLHITNNKMERGHVGSGQGYYAYNVHLPTTWTGNTHVDTGAVIPPPT